jgi:CBS domain-containing protein
MKSVSELLNNRGIALFHIRPDATVFEALQVLAQHEVGALMVMVGGQLSGVVSERDYTRKVALLGKNSKDMKVLDIMTADVITVGPHTGTRACMTLMSQKRIRHLPVVDGALVMGMISIHDLMDDIIEGQEQTIEQLTSYIQQ